MRHRDTLGTLLHDQRRALGVEAKAVAQRVGLSAQYLSDIEHGRRIPPPETLVRLAAVLGLDATALCWEWVALQVPEEVLERMRRGYTPGARGS